MKNNDIKHSMDDITKDKIVLVDAKGNTLGEVERTRNSEKTEETSKKTSQKKKKKSKKQQKKQQSGNNKSNKKNKKNKKSVEEARTPRESNVIPIKNDYVERHNNITEKRRITKKERRKRRRRAIIAVIVEIVLGLAILIIGGGLFAFIYCGVEDVVVEGNSIYSPEEIEEYVIDGDYKNNCVYNVVHNFIKPKKDIPFVDKVKVTMSGLNTVKITVTERVPFGYVAPEEEEAKYFNEDGKITDISDKRLENSTIWLDIIPSGETVGDVIVDDEVMLSSYLDTAKALKANNIFVNSIKIDDNHNIYANKDGLKINFGLKNDMDDKCKRLSIILPQLENQQGTLHLENFSKENTDIVFKRE